MWPVASIRSQRALTAADVDQRLAFLDQIAREKVYLLLARSQLQRRPDELDEGTRGNADAQQDHQRADP